MTAQVPNIALNNGKTIPQLGFGVFLVDADETERIVSDALDVGYRHIDTAAIYGNEKGVGKAISASGIDRDDLFITTKLWNDRQQDAERAFQESLDKLGVDEVDLYLIHWPVPSQDTYAEAWKSLIKIAESGRARSIGVSNFTTKNLQRIIDETGVVPAVNQIEVHPRFPQRELIEFNTKHGIVTEAWGPLGQGKYPLLETGVITEIAAAHGVTPAQVVIRWHLQRGSVLFPKSTHRERMAQNFDVFGFTLTDDQMASLATLDTGERVSKDPDEM